MSAAVDKCVLIYTAHGVTKISRISEIARLSNKGMKGYVQYCIIRIIYRRRFKWKETSSKIYGIFGIFFTVLAVYYFDYF